MREAMSDERPLEDRRITDIKEKFGRVLADVDLLIVPRFTVEDATEGSDVPPALHGLSKEQVEVVRDFMARGKPVLACLGPITPSLTSRPGETPEEFGGRIRTALAEATDGLENLIAERGIEKLRPRSGPLRRRGACSPHAAAVSSSVAECRRTSRP